MDRQSRQLGCIFAALLGFAAWHFRAYSGLVVFIGTVAISLIIVAIFRPSSLRPITVAWLRLGVLLNRFISPLVLGLMYLLTIVPFGLVRQILGSDPLRRKFDPSLESYWLERTTPKPSLEDFKRQF